MSKIKKPLTDAVLHFIVTGSHKNGANLKKKKTDNVTKRQWIYKKGCGDERYAAFNGSTESPRLAQNRRRGGRAMQIWLQK